MIKIKPTLVCKFCFVEAVDHEVTEKQEYKMNGEIYATDKNHDRIPLPRVITKGQHCPKCLKHSRVENGTSNLLILTVPENVIKLRKSSFNKTV